MAKKLTPEAPEVTGTDGLSMADLGVSDGIGVADRPRLEQYNGTPYLMTFHPERWMVSHGAVVPILGSLPLVAGVARVSRTGKGKLNISDAIAEKQRRGWTVLPLDIDGSSYLYEVEGCPGVYLSRWQTANAGSSVISTDGAAYAKWLRKLIDANKIPGPKPYVLQNMRSALTDQCSKLRDQVRLVPSAQIDLDKATADLAAVDTELARMTLVPVKARETDLSSILST